MVALTRGAAKGRWTETDFIGKNQQNLMTGWYDVKSRQRRKTWRWFLVFWLGNSGRGAAG